MILVVLFLVLFFIFSIPVFLILYFIGLKNMTLRHRISIALVRFAFHVVLFLSGVKVIVKGLENIPDDKPVLYVANHSGFFDILAGYTTVKGLCGFVSKAELKKVPFLRLWMYFVNCLFFNRKDMRAAMQMIIDGIEKLKEGISIFIFPEGTRSKDGKLKPFKEGSFKMALKADVPIIPTAITGTSAVFEDHLPCIKSNVVTITYGTPILPADYTKTEQKHIGEIAQKEIAKMLGQA